jgi:hypothetical protein
MHERFYDNSLPTEQSTLGQKIENAIARMAGNIPEHLRMAACVNDLWQGEKDKPLEGLNPHLVSLVSVLFSNPEEARNLLGLGLEKRFSTPDIIGEFQFLNELVQRFEGTNTVCIRMPYGILANSPAEEQRALNAMLKRPDIKEFIVQIFRTKFNIPDVLTLEKPKQANASDSDCIVC